MKLDDLCELFDRQAFPDANAREHPDKDAVLAARAAVTAAVRDDHFLVDCLAYELTRLEQRRGLRPGLVPFFTVPGFGIRFAFGYWPPGRNAGAHEHTAWTITGVCHNELIVETYDRDESYRRQTLVPKNRFDAPAGQVGFIYEPCIHDPRNPTDRWSLSLHVSSPRDGEQLADQERCLPILDNFAARRRTGPDEPYDEVIAARRRQLKIRAIAQYLAQVEAVPVVDLLERCVRQSSLSTRRFIHGLGRTDVTNAGPPTARTPTRAHEKLVLDYRETGDFVALGVVTPRGWVEEFAVSRIAREAIDFCVRTPRFEVRDLPGSLTDEERWAIAEVLEESALFTADASG
ncbi:hypothetical protein [Mycobacterium palustre]|uniref:Uncharacterized protein n=1 Tax=Mycobacterium palustre TaxID=153971 RepID=A0A1X1Z678_9MYCO|nr:hypothetical protein [Mycobacterium palustre]MCV7102164.1 hypothetical protein [Mycobacterium palustre]ORW18842.1 hypothetical protein AWC19_18930 [Mycobacterium palustre]